MSKTWSEVIATGPGPRTKREFIILVLKGMCMGVADLIPGVSGGTIAFISGIYDDLLDSVASMNGKFFKALLTLNFKEAFEIIHIRFLVPLVAGIGFSILALARLMHFLLNEHPIPTWSLFFGLIAASIIILGKELKNLKSPGTFTSLAGGIIFGYVVVSIVPVSTPDSLWFIYLCGMIGITAMILPGLSGSFLLLILGKYEYITGALKNPFGEGNLLLLLVFLCGTTTGLLSFSKVLNFCLKKYHQLTMAFLTGLLIGSMKKVWPWKEVLETKIVRGKVRVLRDANIIPSNYDTEFYLAMGLIIVGFLLVIILEKLAKGRKA
jgi:putative membrane protein